MSEFINGWTKESTIKHIKDNWKGRAYNRDKKVCEYLSVDGKKCAVGLFLSEPKHQKVLAGVGVLVQEYPEVGLLLPLNDKLMFNLQRIHDGGSHIPEEMFLSSELKLSDDEILARMIAYIESLS